MSNEKVVLAGEACSLLIENGNFRKYQELLKENLEQARLGLENLEDYKLDPVRELIIVKQYQMAIKTLKDIIELPNNYIKLSKQIKSVELEGNDTASQSQ